MKKAFQIITAFALIIFFSTNVFADIVYTGSDAFGGTGGNNFVMPEKILESGVMQAEYIKKISLKVSYYRIEKTQVTWGKRNGGEMGQATGENGGTWEQIIMVTGKTGRFVNKVNLLPIPTRIQLGHALLLQIMAG